jgi:hypothetical protein
MNAKLSIGLLAVIAVPVLLASALAQQPSGLNQATPTRRASDVYRLDAATTPASGASVGVSDDKALSAPNPDSAVSLLTEDVHGYGTTYTFSNGSTRNAESVLAQRADELARKLGAAKSETDRSQIKTELSELLEKQFSFRQKRHQEEIAALEAKVKKLKDLVEKRQENRREIIAKRLDQILSNAEGLGW